MERFLSEVEAYAAARGVTPQTVLRWSVNAAWAQWARWRSGRSTPTMRTVESVRAYIAANPPPASQEVAALSAASRGDAPAGVPRRRCAGTLT